jgi:hypothetical protein
MLRNLKVQILGLSVLILICVFFGPLPMSQATVTSALAKRSLESDLWSLRIQSFTVTHFNSRREVYDFSKKLLNQIEDDGSLSLAQKRNLRLKISLNESQLSLAVPEMKLTGFKKSWIDPQNHKSGYVLEPEYE